MTTPTPTTMGILTGFLDEYTRNLPEILSTPFDFNGFSCATDGHAMVMVDGEVVGEPAPDGIKNSVVLRDATATIPDGNTGTTTMDRLIEWAGGLSCSPPCDQCNGAGKITCPNCKGTGRAQHICTECDDLHDGVCMDCADTPSRMVECQCRRYILPGNVGQATLNLHLVARVLRAVTPLQATGPVTVVWPDGPLCMVTFAGTGWRSVVMPVRPDRNQYKNAPRLEVTP